MGTEKKVSLSHMSDPASRAYVPLPTSTRQPVAGARAVGPADPNETLEVTIRLRSRATPQQKADAVAALGAQPIGDRQYLTPDQFNDQFGASPDDLAKVTQFAQQSGLRVVLADAAQRAVIVFGTVAQISAAFHVTLEHYTSPSGDYRGRIGEVHIPADLGGVIVGVFGLDNRPQARPHFVRSRHHRGGATRGAATATQLQLGQPGALIGAEMGQIYNFPSNLNGSGECIGILEFGGGFNENDLRAFFNDIKMPMPNITAVSVSGVQNSPGKDQDSDGEVMLDIEVAATLAPGAKIVVYFAPFTEQGWVNAVNAAIHDTTNRPSVLSISWGYPEGIDIWTDQAIAAVNEVFQSAALQGITVLAASGDDGSRDQVTDGKLHVDFPAASPYVLACGGTTLEFNSSGQFSGEKVWNDGGRDQGGGAGGGGVSDRIARPSWQAGIVPPSANPGNFVGRGVPDVAGNADGATGYAVYVDGQWMAGVGGTSAVSPLWSGLIARINQGLGKRVGFFSPLLYSKIGKTSAFNDVTAGNNDPTGQLGSYKSGLGWDACTGWGSPSATNLYSALSSSSSSNVPNAPSAPSAPTGNGGSATSATGSSNGNSLAIGGVVVLIVVVVVILLFMLGIL
jgi:kumamolisin